MYVHVCAKSWVGLVETVWQASYLFLMPIFSDFDSELSSPHALRQIIV